MSVIPSELSDNSGSVATIDIACSAKLDSSDISSHSVPVQKRLRQASLDAELFGSDHAKRARISSPQTDHRGLLEERSSLRRPLPYPGTVKSGSTVGIGTLGDGQGTVVNSIWSGHKEDKIAITPQRAVSLLYCCCAYCTNVKHHSSCTRLGRMRKEPQVLRPLSCGGSQRCSDRVLHVRIPYLPDTLLPEVTCISMATTLFCMSKTQAHAARSQTMATLCDTRSTLWATLR